MQERRLKAGTAVGILMGLAVIHCAAVESRSAPEAPEASGIPGSSPFSSSGSAKPRPLLIVPQQAIPGTPSPVQELADDLNRRWLELCNQQEQTLHDLRSRQKRARDEESQRISTLQRQLAAAGDSDEAQEYRIQIDHVVSDLNQLREDEARELEVQKEEFEVDRQGLKQQILQRLRSEEESLQAQQTQKQAEAQDARNQQSRIQQDARDLEDRIGRLKRTAAESQEQLTSRVQLDESNNQRWAVSLQEDVGNLKQKIEATNYVEERQDFQRQIDQKTQEQAQLQDSSRRWKESLIQYYGPTLKATNQELQRLTDQLAAPRPLEDELSRKAIEADRAVQSLGQRLSEVRQLQSQISNP